MIQRVAFVAGLLAACGTDSYVVLEISAQCGGANVRICDVPDEVDGFVLRTFDGVSADTPLLREEDLSLDRKLPVQVLLEPLEGTPAVLLQQVDFTLGGAVVGTRTAEHGWDEGRTNRLQINVQLN